MKQTIWALVALCGMTMFFSCDNGETYADMKEREKNAINRFIKDHDIKVITQEQFLAQDSTTNLEENEFVLFNEGGDTITTNQYSSSIVDKMLVKYIHRSRRYQASFTEGKMVEKYRSSVVPQGWIKPFDYIRLTRNAGKIAKIRIIVPHSSGTSNASGYVLPMYYEISYQLGI